VDVLAVVTLVWVPPPRSLLQQLERCIGPWRPAFTVPSAWQRADADFADVRGGNSRRRRAFMPDSAMVRYAAHKLGGSSDVCLRPSPNAALIVTHSTPWRIHVVGITAFTIVAAVSRYAPSLPSLPSLPPADANAAMFTAHLPLPPEGRLYGYFDTTDRQGQEYRLSATTNSKCPEYLERHDLAIEVLSARIADPRFHSGERRMSGLWPAYAW